MAKKFFNESVYLDNGEAIQFFSTDDLSYLQEWAEVIREYLGNDAYHEFKGGVIEDMFSPNNYGIKELGNQYKELRDTFGKLGDFILTSELDDDTKESLNGIEDEIRDKMVDIGDTLCYEFDVIDSKDI